MEIEVNCGRSSRQYLGCDSDESVADLELLQLEDTSAAPSSKDTVALFQGKAGVVRRLDGDSGEVKWEYKDDRFV